MSVPSVRPCPDHHSDSPATVNDALQAAGRGDVAAFDWLYRRTVEQATAVARSVVIDAGQAEEVVQEAYLEVWRWASRFDPAIGGALPWLLRIVRHRSIDRVRHSEAARARERAFLREQMFVGPEESVVDQILRAESHSELHDALGRLTERQREALHLTYFRYCTGRELSARLGLPLGTAKGRVRDGLLGLRAMAVGTS